MISGGGGGGNEGKSFHTKRMFLYTHTYQTMENVCLWGHVQPPPRTIKWLSLKLYLLTIVVQI